MNKTKFLGLSAVVVITVAIIGYKTHLASATQTASNTAHPRVVLVANLGEANEVGDSCAEIIRMVRDAKQRGVAVQEVDTRSQSPLLERYHVLVVPTVIIFDKNGKAVLRLQGEGSKVLQALRQDLAQL